MLKLFFPFISVFHFPLASHASGKQGRGKQKVITTRPAQHRLRQLLIKQPWSKSNHSEHMAREYTDSMLAEEESVLASEQRHDEK